MSELRPTPTEVLPIHEAPTLEMEAVHDAARTAEVTRTQAILNLGRVAFHNTVGWVSEKAGAHADRKAAKIERHVAVDEHIHKFVNGNAGGSRFDVSSMSRRERKRALRNQLKADDAEWAHKTAKRKEMANGGRGRSSFLEKRRLKKQVETQALTGAIRAKDMHIARTRIDLGGHAGARPMRTVERARNRALAEDKVSLRLFDPRPQQERADRKRAKAQKRRESADNRRARAREIRRG